MRYHCSTLLEQKCSKFMLLWKVFDCFSLMWPIPFIYIYLLNWNSLKKWDWSSIQKNDFHCTLRDHCRAINEEKWTKFMSVWKIFFCSFKCDRPKILSPNGVKDISLQSWMVKTPKSSTTTTAVIWYFLTKIPIYFWFFGWNHQVTT